MSIQGDDLELVWQKAEKSSRIGFAVTNLETFSSIFNMAICEESHIQVVIVDEFRDGLYLQVLDWRRGDSVIRFHAYTLGRLAEELLKREIDFPVAI